MKPSALAFPQDKTRLSRRSAGDLGYSKETNALAEAIGEEIALRGGITVYGAGERMEYETFYNGPGDLTFLQKKTAILFRRLQRAVQNVIRV